MSNCINVTSKNMNPNPMAAKNSAETHFPGSAPPRRADGDEGQQQEHGRDHGGQRQQEHEDALSDLVLPVLARDGMEVVARTDPKRAKCQKYGSLSVVGTTL